MVVEKKLVLDNEEATSILVITDAEVELPRTDYSYTPCSPCLHRFADQCYGLYVWRNRFLRLGTPIFGRSSHDLIWQVRMIPPCQAAAGADLQSKVTVNYSEL